jgi:hypothetical protein
MNTTEHAQQHAEHARRVTESWHRIPATASADALARKHGEIERARSDALQRSLDSSRNPQGGDR